MNSLHFSVNIDRDSLFSRLATEDNSTEEYYVVNKTLDNFIGVFSIGLSNLSFTYPPLPTPVPSEPSTVESVRSNSPPRYKLAIKRSRSQDEVSTPVDNYGYDVKPSRIRRKRPFLSVSSASDDASSVSQSMEHAQSLPVPVAGITTFGESSISETSELEHKIKPTFPHRRSSRTINHSNNISHSSQIHSSELKNVLPNFVQLPVKTEFASFATTNANIKTCKSDHESNDVFTALPQSHSPLPHTRKVENLTDNSSEGGSIKSFPRPPFSSPSILASASDNVHSDNTSVSDDKSTIQPITYSAQTHFQEQHISKNTIQHISKNTLQNSAFACVAKSSFGKYKESVRCKICGYTHECEQYVRSHYVKVHDFTVEEATEIAF